MQTPAGTSSRHEGYRYLESHKQIEYRNMVAVRWLGCLAKQSVCAQRSPVHVTLSGFFRLFPSVVLFPCLLLPLS